MVRSSGLAVSVVLVTVVVVAVVGAVVLGPIADETGSSESVTTARDAGGIARAQTFANVEFELLVHANGSTRWTVRYERPLANETQRSNFEAYAERFNSEETRLYEEFVRLARRLVRLGTDTTEREMEARAFAREARIGPLNNRGIVEMSFLWTNFALVRDDGRVVTGDVFEGGAFEGGLYVGPDEQFTIRAGDGLVFQSVAPSPEEMANESLASSESVSWTGEREFDDGRPNAVLAPPSTGSESLPLAVGGVVLILLGVAAAIAWRFGGVPGSGSGSGSSSGSTSGSTTRSPTSGSGSESEANSGSTTPPPEPAVADEELLADDDRVRRLLEANGGRMRQVSIVEETDWSKSKVSMLLSEMESEGQVSKLRIGRENIVSLAGHEPDAGGPASSRE